MVGDEVNVVVCDLENLLTLFGEEDDEFVFSALLLPIAVGHC